MPAIEIAVQDVAGARIAHAAGADRVELCQALGATGGLTPSHALIQAAVGVGISVHVLIRSRPGGFVYTADEIDLMAREVQLTVAAGAHGVVVGALTAGGAFDLGAMRELAAAAGAAQLTCHRAFDVAPDRATALEHLVELGFARVLTSGGATRSIDGATELAALAAQGTGIEIMAGGGVRLEDIPALLGLGLDAVHLSAKAVTPDPGQAGPGGGVDGGLEVTDEDQVRAAVRAVHGHGPLDPHAQPGTNRRRTQN